MKFFFCTIATVSAVVLLGKTASAEVATFRLLPYAPVAQRTDGSISRQQRTAAQFSKQTQRLSQRASNPDLALLSKVITGFLKSDDYQTQSTMNVDAVIGNTTVSSEAQIQTTAQFPNKFRTEVSFAKPGAQTPVKTLIISDGERVWVYRADLKQYAVFSFKAFDQLDDSYWIGFTTTMFAQAPPEAKTVIAKGALSDADLRQKIGLELSALNGGPRTIDNQNFYAYEYKDAKQNFLLSAFVEPSSAVLKELRIDGKYEDSDITMVERILSRVAIAPVSANTFTFTPPKGTKKVKALALGPL
jgi:outer membrane lipoprotein-sorting protein